MTYLDHLKRRALFFRWNGLSPGAVTICLGEEGLKASCHCKCKNISTTMFKDVEIEVPKSIETRTKCSMHADKGRG